jgi:hypothetical protein
MSHLELDLKLTFPAKASGANLGRELKPEGEAAAKVKVGLLLPIP